VYIRPCFEPLSHRALTSDPHHVLRIVPSLSVVPPINEEHLVVVAAYLRSHGADLPHITRRAEEYIHPLAMLRHQDGENILTSGWDGLVGLPRS
jgi:hypothetical protein